MKRVNSFVYFLVGLFSLVGLVGVINQLFQLNLFGIMLIGSGYNYFILACFLSLTFLIYPAREKDANRLPWYDWLLFSLTIIINIFFLSHSYNIITEGWEYAAPNLAMIPAFIQWLIVLEGVRRTGGKVVFFICLLFSVYPIFSHQLPGIFYGVPFSLKEIGAYHVFSTESIIGIPTRVIADTLIGFIFFGAAMIVSGGGKFFMDFALSLLGGKRGGAAKVSIISSALMASLSGSVITNVVSTGTLTIPTMKKTGYSSNYAAAIEAVASTGGVTTPPVMGAAGFIIASFLNISYVEVMIAAAFPAILYYLLLLVQADVHAAKLQIVGLPKKEIPFFKETIKKGWFYLGSIVILVVLLVGYRIENLAPFYVILFLFLCSFFRKETRITLRKFLDFLFESGKLISHITAILAGIGLIVGACTGTGVANSFSREIVQLVGGNWFFIALVGAFVAFFLGMGMTVTAVYVFLAVVLVPAFVAVGLDPLASNLFVLYWANLSYITPPVALASITAASIAEADSMKTGFLSAKMAIVAFLMPFFVLINPALIFKGDIQNIIFSCLTAIFGTILIGCGAEGYSYFFGKLKFWQKVIFIISGLLMLYPHMYTFIVGAILFLIMLIAKVSNAKVLEGLKK